MTRLHELNQKNINYINDLKDTNGRFDKDDLIHMLDMVFGVGNDYIFNDTDLRITLDRHIREANSISDNLGLTEPKECDTQGTFQWNKPVGLLNRSETDTPSVILFYLYKIDYTGNGVRV